MSQEPKLIIETWGRQTMPTVKYAHKIQAHCLHCPIHSTLLMTMATLQEQRYICLWLYSPCGPWPLFQFLNPCAAGRTPWTGNQPVERPLPTHSTAQTQNKRTDIHPFSGIRTHDHSVRASEDSSCLRPRDRCDWPFKMYLHYTIYASFVYCWSSF
jgi:hypothetical protein